MVASHAAVATPSSTRYATRKVTPTAPDAGQRARLQGRAAVHGGPAAIGRTGRRQRLCSRALREWLAGRGTQPAIPPRRNRKIQYDYDKAIYKQRNIVERLFRRIKDWRRIATRFDRNIKNFMSAIAIAATVIWWLK